LGHLANSGGNIILARQNFESSLKILTSISSPLAQQVLADLDELPVL
jgi:hypothetical protein